jgi:hypothetical protein
MLRVFPALLAACFLFAGCERPFIEPVSPTVELVSPEDLSVVRTEPDLPLAFRASTSFGTVGRVEVNGEAATFVSGDNLFLDTLRLEEGLNRIVVEAFGEGDTVGGDTLFALYLPAAFVETNARLPDGLGGHAAVTLADGPTLLTGGAISATAPALPLALVFEPATFEFRTLLSQMVEARAGHAASLLPDGRVLLTGGSRTATPTDLDDLVTIAEVYDPNTGTFTAVPVVAEDGGPVDPVQRTEHTVTVLQGEGDVVVVLLYGGLGNAGSVSNPRLGPLPFMRRLVFEDGPEGPRLVAPDRSEGFRFTSIARHTQTPLAGVGPDGFGRYLVAGASPPDDPDIAAPFELFFAPDRLDALPVGALAEPRIDHAAAPLEGGLVLVTGGVAPGGTTTPDGSDVGATGEVFAGEAGQFFRFEPTVRLAVPRWGHTATNLDDSRILLVGGFSASGQALPFTELFVGSP